MKESGYQHWSSPNSGATNESDFTALPGGLGTSGHFTGLMETTKFWALPFNGTSSFSQCLSHTSAELVLDTTNMFTSISVRCLKDETPIIPLNQTLQNVTVYNGQTNYCYNALQIISVAGSGTTFAIENGGSATMIAGQKISYLPGTTVQAGGYLHGYIAPSGPWCTTLAIPSVIVAEYEVQGSIIQSSFKIYPNPTSENFTLEFKEACQPGMVVVNIYGMCGEKILSETTTGAQKHEFSLANRPPGIYLIHVISGNKSETGKIIKL